MTIFKVWAPNAQTVELEIERQRILMDTGDGGWWIKDLPEAGPGTEYAYVLDGGQPMPDPRSPYQPKGVHGPSCVVDHTAFDWTDRGFQAAPLASALIYELHVGTFTPEGTFDSAIARLDHLVDLGITHIELMPVAEFPGETGWGYDGVDLWAPHHAYGGPEGLKRLVETCHRKGLAVLLDVVYNHLGPDGNYLGQFGPYFTSHHITPWGQAVNLDGPGSDEVRRFLIDNALMWLRDYHLDGLRLDAVHAIIDTSAVHFLEQLAAEVDVLEATLGRHLALIAESDLNDPRIVQLPEMGGYGIDAQWSDDFHHALHTALTGEQGGYYKDFGSLATLAKALERTFVFDGRYSDFRGRRHGRPAIGIPRFRFLAYLQNHDQTGNRARGERSSQLLSPRLLKVGAAILLTSPFTPMLFMGEEWGASTPFQYFTDHQDPELAHSVSQGRRDEFAAFDWEPEEVPDPQARGTAEASKLRWDEAAREPHAGLLDWHRRLIQVRRQLPAISDTRLDGLITRYDEQARWLVIRRGPVAVACNLAEADQLVPLESGSVGEVILASDERIEANGDGLEMPGESVGVVRVRE